MKVIIKLSTFFQQQTGKGALAFEVDHVRTNTTGDLEIRTKEEEISDELQILVKWTDAMVAGEVKNGKCLQNANKYYRKYSDENGVHQKFESWIIFVPKTLLSMISSGMEFGERI